MKVTVAALARVCGMASIAAGVLWTAGTLLNYGTAGTIGPGGTAGAVIGLGTHTIMVFAFLGIFSAQVKSGSVGRLGALGAAVGIIGSTLVVGELAIALARSVGAIEVIRPPLVIGVPATLTLLVGVLLTGLATIRASATSRLSGLPFVVSVPLALLAALHEWWPSRR